ncbi:MAG TPA: hypothetical protein VJ972_15895 [Anaerolineales bacterium]|nr:hypothetical protein [Anaerolineales bacterium]
MDRSNPEGAHHLIIFVLDDVAVPDELPKVVELALAWAVGTSGSIER